MQRRGRRWQRHLPLTLLFCALAAAPARATPSLWGDTGLIAAPSDQMATDGNISINYSRTFGPRSFHSAPVPNNVYSLSLSFLPRFEFVLVYNEVITGRVDSDTPYLTLSSLERSMQLKLQLLKEGELAAWTPTVAIGARDPFGNSEANIGAVGLGATVHSRAYYAVAGKTLEGWHGHLGFAWGPDPSQLATPWVDLRAFGEQGDFHLRGLFLGLESPRYLGFLSALAEYDSKRFNWGVSVGPFYGMVLKPVMIDVKHFNVGFSWTARL